MSPMPSDEYSNRIRRARDLMRARGIDGLIVTDPVNYSYFTGHKVASSMRSRPAIFILPLHGASSHRVVRAGYVRSTLQAAVPLLG
jgi:Xaa-Pro dipeptidase